MIELRWLEVTKSELRDDGSWLSKTEKRLQYRQIKWAGEMCGATDGWTEWMDIPTEREAT